VRVSGLRVAGHQPHYLPWLGYVDKLSKVDVFCLVDCIPFDAKLYQHRNRIRTWDGEGQEWLVVPVASRAESPPLLCDLAIEPGSGWAAEHWRRIRTSYERAPHFARYAPFFEDLYARPWERLVDLNAHMIQGLIDQLGLATRLVRASELGVDAAAAENLHVQVCSRVGGTVYLSGAGGGCAHVDEAAFAAAGITHERQQFTHPAYPQIHGPFVPSLGAIDLLFNCGEESRRILTDG